MNTSRSVAVIAMMLFVGAFASANASSNGTGGGNIILESENATTKCMTDVVYERKGDYSHIISSGTNCFTFACDPDPNKTCFCYDKVNKTATLDPGGQDIVINYIMSIEFVGTFIDEITGATGELWEVTTEPE